MRVSDKDIGYNIQEARYRQSLSQAQLAELLGVDRSAISRIEQGSRSVTASELSVISKLLNCPVVELLKPRPTVSVKASRSNLFRFRSGPVSPEDQAVLSWFLTLHDSLSQVSDSCETPNVTRNLALRADTEAGELLARRIRKHLGIPPNEPISGFSGLLTRLGLAVFGARFPSKSRVAGCMVVDEKRFASIIVNYNQPRSRQRFTLAHELAHYLMDRELRTTVCDAGWERPGPRSHMEYRADVFASALLLPRQTIQAYLASGFILDSLAEMETSYGISHAAALARLRALGIVNDSTVRVLKKMTPPKGETTPLNYYRVLSQSMAKRLRMDESALQDSLAFKAIPDKEVVP